MAMSASPAAAGPGIRRGCSGMGRRRSPLCIGLLAGLVLFDVVRDDGGWVHRIVGYAAVGVVVCPIDLGCAGFGGTAA